MKKLAIVLALIPVLGWSQVKSGVTYSEHPGYDVVTESYRIWESGTEADLRGIYTEDAKIWGPGDDEAGTVDDEVKGMIWWQENFDISFTNMDPATPDIIKYKGEKGVWTLDWMIFTGVNKESGDTVSGQLHTANYVNEDGKIEMTLNYFDRESMGAQIQASLGMHRNGRVYDEHPLIDKLNQMVAHFEAGEIEQLTTYFAADATFNRLSTMGETPLTLEERIETWNASVAQNSVRDLVQYGYPDAVYYARSDSWTVYSWWWANNTNAETGEVTKKFLHLVHNFNSEGKVTSEGVYLQQ
jgi:ketosteroid isomerase-like protein|tara:strand:+ start:190 stop:1086 length:897 start_codon:yes stop_codon:yes gene_type:complete